MSTSAQSSNDAPRMRLYNLLVSFRFVTALVVLCVAAANATALFGVSPESCRHATVAAGALFIAWIAAVFLLRNSKERWLTAAIVIQGLGGAAIFLLPSSDMTLPNGKCTHVMDLGKALELAGLLYGLSATIWLAAGAWMTHEELSGLDKIAKDHKWKASAAGLFKSAHKQISMGLLTAAIGVVFVLWSYGVEIYFRRFGIESPTEHVCKIAAGGSPVGTR